MKKCAKCGGSMYKTGGSTMKTKLDIASKPKVYGIPQTGGTGPITMKKGGSTAVKHSCPPGTVRSATGGCVSERPRFKKGGSAFGMLSVKAGVDKNPKATAADRIAGAKLNKKQDGGANKSQPNPNSPTKQASYSKYDAVRNSASAMRKKTALKVPEPPTNTPVKRKGGMIKKKC